MDKVCIYNYLDYRTYLNDLFLFVKGKNPQFSYRVFSRKAGFSSPNFLKLVIQGVRNLTRNSIVRFAKAFKIEGEEKEFFENLVLMNQATTHDEKNFYYYKLSKSRGYLKVKKIEKDYYEYYSRWYNPAILELVAFKKGKITAEEISRMLLPKVSLTGVKDSLDLLIRLGFIRKDKNNCFQQAFPNISTGPEVESLMIKNYHLEMIKIAGQSLENFPGSQRDISSVTITITKEQIPDLKEKIAKFRKELLGFNREENKTDSVVQFNLQMFPLIKMEEL